MIYDGLDTKEYFTVEDIRRHLLPPVENHTFRQYHLKTRHGQSLIEVDIRLIEDTYVALSELKRKVAGLLYKTSPKPLILRDDPTRYDNAILDGTHDFEKFWTSGKTTLKFLVPEGESISIAKKTVSIAAGSSSTITIEGTAETRPVITATMSGSVANIKLTNTTYGETLLINKAYSAGNVVTIDLLKRFVTMGGGSQMASIPPESDFFSLRPGENQVSSNVPIKLEYQERWL